MKKCFFCFILFLFPHFEISSQSNLFSGGMAINQIVDNLANRIENVLNQLENIFSQQAFDIRQHLSITLDQLNQIVEGNINLTFDKLNEQQRNALINFNSLLIELEEKGYTIFDRSELLVDKSIAFAGTLPLSKKRPTITNVLPSYFIYGENDSEITIKGSWLAKRKTYLAINGLRIPPIHKVDNELKFKIPTNQFTDSININKLNTYTMPLFIKGIKFDLSLCMVPNNLGRYEVEVSYKTVKRVNSVRKEKFSYGNSHCQGNTSKTWTFNAKSGWKIDVNSVRIIAQTVSQKSRLNGIRNKTERGFQITGVIGNNGSCIRNPFGGYIARDARGVINGVVTWTEYKDEYKTSTYELLNSGDLYWGEDVDINIPDNVAGIKLKVNKFNGETSISPNFDGIINNEKWFVSQYIKEGSILIIRPRDLSNALRVK